MGCLQILLEDRFNNQVQDIYKKAFKYIVTEIGNEFDCIPYLGPEDPCMDEILAKDNNKIEASSFMHNDERDSNSSQKPKERIKSQATIAGNVQFQEQRNNSPNSSPRGRKFSLPGKINSI